ncbi:MAG: replicative DNA helicase [Planctomycetaceae bacterium]|jgi:replicative DNA helicase|nr:replicative DNA helicase [Planctomycetaceae bacterium]
MSEGEKRKPRKSRKPNLSEPIDLSVLEKAPPHDLEAERAVLGALFREPELCDDVVMVLRDPDDFYHDAHKRIYSHLMKMRSDNSKIDLLLLVNNLKTTDELDLVGGHAYLGDLMTSVPISAHAEHYAKIVRDKATLRKLIHAGSEIVRDAYAPETQTKDLLNKAASEMNLLCETQTTNQVTDMEALMVDVAAHMDRLAGGLVDGVKTGFVDLDTLIGGLHPNELIILAARTGMGKTALALNITENIAVKGHTVLFVSLEMAKIELALRLICSRSQLSGWKVKHNRLDKDELRQFSDTANELGRIPLYIDDTPQRSVAEIAAVARRLKRQQDLQLLVIDYIGLIRAENPAEPRQEQVAKIARQLKLLARELHLPVLCLAQLNRQADARGKDERPRLSHLRESGAIEQDADVVMFVHREEMGMSREQAEEKGVAGKAELIVAKQRNGATDDIDMFFFKEYTRFCSPQEQSEEGYKKDFERHAEEEN